MTITPDEVESPADFRDLPPEELGEFAETCRERLIESVSKSGGHFGASLGVVELTVALHALFDTPDDKLIWDVGHQGYIHKMITGRNDRLETIRQKDGLAPFLKRQESEFDVFNAGHASTSISAGVGIAEAFKHQGRDNEVVSIIGDGAITAGMAYEALNHGGWEESNLIVVLNDNGMSIARNVGAINRYFDRLIHLPAYEQIKDNAKQYLGMIPKYSETALDIAGSLEKSVKDFVFPKIMFEELGFKYFGPVDGHDMSELIDEFKSVKSYDGPRFVHVLTEKGHGYEPAEEDDKYAGHAMSPFNIETGEPKSNGGPTMPKWSKWMGKTLTEFGKKNEKIHAITAAMRKGTQTVQFAEEIPERFYDVGIAEQHAVTFSAGLATQGEIPVSCIYSTFLQRGYDQVVHDVCLMDLPVRFVLDRAGIVGGDGDTHQGIHDMVYMRSLPNIVLGAPVDEYAMQNFIKTAIEYDDHPFAFRFPRARVDRDDPNSLDELETYEVGKGERIREGHDVALIAIGAMVPRARKAAEELSDQGISASVVNARWVKPMDRDLISETINNAEAVVTVEEGRDKGGFGAGVLECMAQRDIQRPSRILGVPRGIVDHGSREEWLEEFGLTPGGIARTARDLLNQRETTATR
ncbi:MAG: 1-deoxy-D-xylulose-5-phosphate synthase [bacterium]